jgi:hypothetical protein
MRRWVVALLSGGLLGAGLLVAGPVGSFSDGIAGSSGQIEEHLRTCNPGPYCVVKPAYCGGCHGTYEEMWRQEGSKPTPQEHVGKLTFKMNGDANGGTARGAWEYTPGQTFSLDIQLANERPAGQYNQGAFDLNASAGTLAKWTPGDEDVRITGGTFQHAGTKNPDVPLIAGHKYGATESDETRFAGEATNTAKGAETRQWKVKWTSPASTPPRGVALVMTAMLPDGDGLDSCTMKNCNSSQGYETQDKWDWYGFMIPRRILCERGAYATFKECSDAVYKYILPPSPPVNTCGPDNPDGCDTTTAADGGGGNGTPAPSLAAGLLGLGVVAGAWRRRRR